MSGKLKFVYVVAYTTQDAIDEGAMELAFEHLFVEAENEEEAYSIGMHELDDEIDGLLVNNYVIPLP